MSTELSEQEVLLDDFDPAVRRSAAEHLAAGVERGEQTWPAPKPHVNLHIHSFYSYNAYGYSPTRIAWKARREGLEVAGLVDFDVLDGLHEFLEAGDLFNLRSVVSLESRVVVPGFLDREINSPGEPGISYHMGVGFTRTDLDEEPRAFLEGMRRRGAERNLAVIERVNDYLDPVRLDPETDVAPLTPNGNATERHLCLAYARKAAHHLAGEQDLIRFWSDKLGEDASGLDLPDGPKLQALIRARTMKKGGVAYRAPDEKSFPAMADMNRFVLQAGAIPTVTWLNGLSEGEQAMPELLDEAQSSGATALNIIPDRNFTPGVKDEKVENLYRVVELAEARHMPIIVGTEMNSPGLKFVDDFDSDELSPLVPVFLKGAHIFYAHTALQRHCGLGYTSEWAASAFSDAAAKNQFYKQVGYRLQPAREACLRGLGADAAPRDILDAIPKP